MAVPSAGGAGRSRLLVATVLTAAVVVVASYAAPKASAEPPVERVHPQASAQTSAQAKAQATAQAKAEPKAAKVKKVKVDPKLFGVHDYSANSLHRAGTGSIRLWDAGVQWKDIFPTELGTPQWSRLDSLVTQAHENGTEVTLVLGLTPSYAGATPTSMPDLGDVPELRPRRDGALQPRQLAGRRRTSLPRDRGVPGVERVQHRDLLDRWLRRARSAGQDRARCSRRGRPRCEGGRAGDGDPPRVPAEGSQDFYQTTVEGTPVWKYVDAISLNLYPLDAYPNPDPTRAGTPEDSMGLLQTVRGILANDGVPRRSPSGTPRSTTG